MKKNPEEEISEGNPAESKKHPRKKWMTFFENLIFILNLSNNTLKKQNNPFQVSMEVFLINPLKNPKV